MGKLLYDLLQTKGIEFYQIDRISLDNYYYEPFQDMQQTFEEEKISETENVASKKRVEPFPRSIFCYFLDGSRKPYKIGDMITTDNKFVPVVAGQIGTACCYRTDDKTIKKYELKRKNVLMLFDSIPAMDYAVIKEHFEAYMAGSFNIELHKYRVDKIKDDNPTNAAVAKIQEMMHDMEIQLLTEMTEKNILSTNQMLVLDGSLQFLRQKFKEDIFYNVVGVSKSFNPNLTGILKRKKHIGTVLAQLNFGERTPVYKYDTVGNIKHTIGAWYLRIREPKWVRSPLEGIVKIEKMAMKEDVDRGAFHTSMIDNISACILAERNPTCFGNDNRWANHLYPIYLTEKLLKKSFISDLHFLNMF